MSKTSWMCILAAMCVLPLSGCERSGAAIVATPTSPAAAAATVNGAPVSASLVDLVVRQRAEHGHAGAPQPRETVLDQLVTQSVLAQEAVKLGLDKTAEVADQVELAQRAILAKAFIQHYNRNHPVSAHAVKARYEKLKSEMGAKEKRFPPFEQIRPSLEAQVAQEELGKVIAELRGKSKIEVAGAQGAAATSRGW